MFFLLLLLYDNIHQKLLCDTQPNNFHFKHKPGYARDVDLSDATPCYLNATVGNMLWMARPEICKETDNIQIIP